MAAPALAPTRWQIDPAHSLVEFAVRHMMVSTAKGRFRGVRGTLTLDEADLTRSSVEVEIDVASIDTGDPQRDAHLRSPDFFDAERFPTIRFQSTRIEPAGQDRLRLFGNLTIRDVTREVALDVAANGQGVNPWGQPVVGFSAETSINRRGFGLTWNMALETGGVLVSDAVRIVLEIEATRAG